MKPLCLILSSLLSRFLFCLHLCFPYQICRLPAYLPCFIHPLLVFYFCLLCIYYQFCRLKLSIPYFINPLLVYYFGSLCISNQICRLLSSIPIIPLGGGWFLYWDKGSSGRWHHHDHRLYHSKQRWAWVNTCKLQV